MKIVFSLKVTIKGTFTIITDPKMDLHFFGGEYGVGDHAKPLH